MPRRDELLEEVVEYILDHGLADLSLRPLAAATGTKARLLIYHFGSRDALVDAALKAVLRRVQESFVEMGVKRSFEQALMEFWRWATAKKNARVLRLVFEVHGLAPRNPRLYGGYVRAAFASWRRLLTAMLGDDTRATLAIAIVDGLLMDFLATGDRARTTRALSSFAKTLRRKR